VLYPNTLARLEELGALGLVEAHRPPPLHTAWFHAGLTFEAAHTPIRGRDYAICVRRITLDAILVGQARAAGVDLHEGFTVRGVLGRGDDGDPVRGVVGGTDRRESVLRAPLVVGADGRHSTISRAVGARTLLGVATGTMMLYAYWRDLPAQRRQDFFHELPWIGTHFPADDGFHVVALIGPVDAYPRTQRDAFYQRQLSAIGGLRERIVGGRQVGPVVGTRRLNGYYREATGAGWLLTGDAGHFKHPAAVQGIADALHAAEALAPMILAGTQREEFPDWRARATHEMHAFSRFVAGVPTDDVLGAIMRTATSDREFARDLVDIWSRSRRPWEVIPRVPELLAAAGSSPEAVLAALEPDAVAV
jgi:flavin-dependent dehydrogenase